MEHADEANYLDPVHDLEGRCHDACRGGGSIPARVRPGPEMAPGPSGTPYGMPGHGPGMMMGGAG